MAIPLTAVTPTWLDCKPGREIVITGTFPVNKDLSVTINSQFCLSGVISRPLVIRTARADRLVCYLPKSVTPGRFSVTVTDIGTPANNGTLANAVVLAPVQGLTTLKALRRSWAGVFKVGDRR